MADTDTSSRQDMGYLYKEPRLIIGAPMAKSSRRHPVQRRASERSHRFDFDVIARTPEHISKCDCWLHLRVVSPRRTTVHRMLQMHRTCPWPTQNLLGIFVSVQIGRVAIVHRAIDSHISLRSLRADRDRSFELPDVTGFFIFYATIFRILKHPLYKTRI